MNKTRSIKENHIFRALYSRGQSGARRTMVLYARRHRSKAVNHLGITVSVKLGCAVVRTRLRRRLRECYRTHEAEFRPGYHMVIVARTRAVRASYGELEQALLSLAGQLGLLKAAPAAQPAKEPEAHA